MAILSCKAPSGDPTNVHFATAMLRSSVETDVRKSTGFENYTYIRVMKVGCPFYQQIGQGLT